MSYQKLLLALNEAKHKKFYRIYGNSDDNTVYGASLILEINLSKQHKTFLKEVGNISFSGFEFYGICNSEFKGKSIPCAVEMTIRERKMFNLPKHYVIFCSFDDGIYGYLDYSNLNVNGEPPLVALLNNGNNIQVIKKVSEDLGDYIYSCVHESN